jgi:hypothetical protein
MFTSDLGVTGLCLAMIPWNQGTDSLDTTGDLGSLDANVAKSVVRFVVSELGYTRA